MTIEEFIQLRDLYMREAYLWYKQRYNNCAYHRYLEYISVITFLEGIIRFMRGELEGL